MLENYQGKRIFVLKDNEVKMGLKDVALISAMKVVTTEANQPSDAPYV